MGLVVFAMGVVAVVRGQQGCSDAPGDVDQLGIGLALLRQALVLQLDEQVVASEDVLEACRLLERTLIVAVEERLQHMTAEASRGGDDARGIPLEQLPVDTRLVVVALHEREAGELDQVVVARLVLGEQGQVVVELLAPLGVAARVVDPPPPRGPLGAVVVRHVGLGTDDRLDPLRVALLVELEGAVHVSVIGDADRRLAVLDRLGHQVGQARRTVEHRVLGVDVEVGERFGHGRTAGALDRRSLGW